MGNFALPFRNRKLNKLPVIKKSESRFVTGRCFQFKLFEPLCFMVLCFITLYDNVIVAFSQLLSNLLWIL